MNVNNIGTTTSPHFRVSENGATSNDSNGVESSSDAKRDLSAIKSSKLLESLKSATSDGKDNRVAEIKAKSGEGYFATREAAEKAADSILDS